MDDSPVFAVHLKPRPSRAAGLTLVELMVAMVLGLVLIAGVVAVVVSASSNYSELGNISRQVENGRYAVQVLGDDVRHAGFYGEFYDLTPPSSLPDPCAADLASLRMGMGLPIQGADGIPADCGTGDLPDYLDPPDDLPNTDVLVIRRAATVPTPTDELVSDEVYLQGRPSVLILDVGAAASLEEEDSDEDAGNAGSFNLTQRDGSPATIRRYLVHIYYICQSSDCAGGDDVPTLARVELSHGGLGTVTPIAEGIENLQLRYGIDVTDDGAPDGDFVPAGSVTDWSNVVAVELNLLARAVDPSPGYSDTKSYVLGDVAVTEPGDAFKRRVFTSDVRAVNPSSRREL